MNIDDDIYDGIARFEERVSERYADPEDAKAAAYIAERVAELIHKDVEALSTTNDGETWTKFRAVMASRDLEEDLDFALQARLAFHLTPSFKDVASRCWHLAELLQPGKKPEAAERFLARVARCYLLGFVPECLVMCRAALESGLNARLDSASQLAPIDSRVVRSMRTKLTYAAKVGWLPNVSADRLHTEVWQRGSHAAHNDPVSVGNDLEAIKLTIAALSDLWPSSMPMSEGAR